MPAGQGPIIVIDERGGAGFLHSDTQVCKGREAMDSDNHTMARSLSSQPNSRVRHTAVTEAHPRDGKPGSGRQFYTGEAERADHPRQRHR